MIAKGKGTHITHMHSKSWGAHGRLRTGNNDNNSNDNNSNNNNNNNNSNSNNHNGNRNPLLFRLFVLYACIYPLLPPSATAVHI